MRARSPSQAVLALLLLGTGALLIAYSVSGRLTAARATQPDPTQPTAIIWNPSPSNAASPLIKGARLARLEVPRLQQSLFVVEGSDEASLKTGPGHVQGTALPGDDGNCVIAGHRDTHFRFLSRIRHGDRLFLETTEGRFCYRVTGTRVIDPADLQVLQPTPTAQLHLITCFPFHFVGHAPQRYVVTAVPD